MILKKAHSLPKSTRILTSLLWLFSGIIFFIKLSYFRSELQKEGDSNDIKFHDIRVPFLQLIPKYALVCPWVVITSIFAEISVFSFMTSNLILVVSTRYVERFWGYKEVIKFVLIVGSLTNFLTVLITIVSNLMRSDILGMTMPLGGGISYYFGFLVVLKQLVPEHNIILFQGLINFRVKHLPFILLCIVTFWSLLISRSLYPAVPSTCSFFISFIYLRFYQSFINDPLLPITSANGSADTVSLVKGDASETFKLIELFPAVFKPFLSVLFDKIYDFGILLGIITPFNDDSVEQSNLRAQKRQEQINSSHKNVANFVAERRRQVALQVIEDRINSDSKN